MYVLCVISVGWKSAGIQHIFVSMPAPTIGDGGIMFSSCHVCSCVCESVRLPVRWTWYFINRLGEFHQIYNFGARVDKDERIRFWSQRSKVKMTTAPNMIKKSTFAPFRQRTALKNDRLNWLQCAIIGSAIVRKMGSKCQRSRSRPHHVWREKAKTYYRRLPSCSIAI